jgi:hypothetical protein
MRRTKRDNFRRSTKRTLSQLRPGRKAVACGARTMNAPASARRRTNRLPRGISNIIVAVVYQPPAADDATMKDYLISSLEILEIKYHNCAIVLAGDFNKTLLPLLQSAVKVSLTSLLEEIELLTKFLPTLQSIFHSRVVYPHLVFRTIKPYLSRLEFVIKPPSPNAN